LLAKLGVDTAWPDLAPGGSYNQWNTKQRVPDWGETQHQLPRWPTQ
jgi:hypothetical protein